jgi:uncharacterized membrane protein YfcA
VPSGPGPSGPGGEPVALAPVHLTYLDQLAAGGAAALAGAVNSLAGGGSLISFPTLVALGIPAVSANVTNTVSLLPGYLSGAVVQRSDLEPQLASARLLAGVAAAGGLVGSVLLVLIPGTAFRQAVPYLIVVSCALLAFGDRLRPQPADPPQVADPPPVTGGTTDLHTRHSFLFLISIFVGGAYGGFFGAGLGIMLLGLMGIFLDESLTRLNALKQALAFVINLMAALFFLFSGRVTWTLVPAMAVGSLLGGLGGGRLVKHIDARFLRGLVVIAGLALAIAFWVNA